MNKKARIERAKMAGSIRSQAKAKAARLNGKKGGRPGNPEIKRLMERKGVTRQRAHQILAEQRANRRRNRKR